MRHTALNFIQTAQAKIGAAFQRLRSADGFVNAAANLGGGAYGLATNLLSAGTYEFDRLTLNQMLLRAAYRGSWIVAMACDAIAEDMTKAGVEPDSELPPDRWKRIEKAAVEAQLWPQLTEWLRWGRLFGGAILVPMIDGQDPSTPLRLETVSKGQLRGFDVYDRWRLIPDLSSRIQTPGRWRGFPEYYTTVPDAAGTPVIRIHYTRALRFDASPLPHWERIGNMMWGMSIIERIFANIRAFDSTTTGAAQLALRAHLRTLKVPGFFDARGGNGIAWQAMMRRFQDMRLFQTSENITVIDKEEEMQHFTQTFAGMDGILTQLGQQVWGAIGIPEVRALRKSASGLNASDEWALNCYYDDNHTRQETTLREPVTLCYELLSRHALGEGLPEDFTFQFRHLSKPNPEKRATVAQALWSTLINAYDTGLVTAECALKEMKQAAPDTGIGTNITDEMIKDAESLPPKSEIAGFEGAPSAASLPKDDNPEEAKLRLVA